MKRLIVLSTLFAVLMAGSCALCAQTPMLIHSHNDYIRNVPFYQAYAQGVSSVEADVYLVDGELLVAHDRKDVKDYKSLEALYLEPIARYFRENGGRPYADAGKSLQLMVDIKDDSKSSLEALISLIEAKYSDVFCTKGVQLTITDNVPAPEDFCKYPEWIMFDGSLDIDYTEDQLARIALFSAYFGKYSHWNGKGAPIAEQEKLIREAIESAHSRGKTIRFWGGPEGLTVYYVFYNLGVDWINTDRPEKCAEFFSKWGDKNFQIGVKNLDQEGVSNTGKLDRATRDFAGFQRSKLQLSSGIEVYHPTYRNDGANKKIKNVILLIGDGMGMNQISAGDFANHGLSIMQMKHVGFQHNQAKDQFTTDSAAGGSALATGERHPNRYIACGEDGTEYPSLIEWFAAQGKATGVLTLGNIADATPATFLSHNKERDESEDITADLLDTHADLICGCGMNNFKNRKDGRDNLLGELEAKGFSITENYEDIPELDGRVLCLDNRMSVATDEASLHLLANATKTSIDHLKKTSKKGFFLMVEGAKIDYSGHTNCLPACVIETLGFDLAVAEALKFADANGETLVIVSADHETGGLALIDGNEQTGRIMGLYFIDDHTPAILPVFSYGPHSEEFTGSYMNVDIAKKIKKLTSK